MVLTPEAGAFPADPMLPRPWWVRKVRRETHDTFTLELEPGNGVRRTAYGVREGEAFSPAAWTPGQFNMLYVFGVGEVPVSISGDPGRPQTLVHTVREVGTVTRGLRHLKKGDAVGVRGPFGSHWPVEEAAGNDIVIVTGGIGLAPLRPVVYQVLAQRDRFGRVILLYGTRTPEDILYLRELEQWRGRFDMDVHVTVDRGTGTWRGNVGVVTTLIPRAAFDPLDTVAMVCGPEVMMRFVIMELQRRGVGVENIFLSLERNMKCAVGFCGHCQFGPTFICKDGPVFRFDRIRPLFGKREI